MAEPILIIHGVANHDPAPFGQAVEALQKRLGNQWELLPVFWGDLGGASDDIGDCLPVLRQGQWNVRSDAAEATVAYPLTRADVGGGLLPTEARAQLIAEGAVQGQPVRGAELSIAIAEAASQELPRTQVLQYIDDPVILRDLGQAIQAALEGSGASGPARPSSESEFAVRGGAAGSEEVRGLLDPIATATQKVMRSVDDMMGRLLGNRLGQLNQQLRGAFVGPFAGFCGDILVYQRNQEKIQQRLWDVLAAHGQGYGTAAKPVHAIAHSLGGVIAFDTAVQADSQGRQLWLKSFTTFGSQAAFFHIVDRRLALAKYRHQEPVQLPATIGRWINLWDTIDLLAFTAGTVFRLHDGSVPRDIPVQDAFSELIDNKGWTHSIYWQSEELRTALQEALG